VISRVQVAVAVAVACWAVCVQHSGWRAGVKEVNRTENVGRVDVG
jgi:hypothetical protein